MALTLLISLVCHEVALLLLAIILQFVIHLILSFCGPASFSQQPVIANLSQLLIATQYLNYQVEWLKPISLN
jgi:hypothetical protein